MQTSQAPKIHPRKNTNLATLHHNAAKLMKRVAESGGQLSKHDIAMAGIYAGQLEKRKSL